VTLKRMDTMLEKSYVTQLLWIMHLAVQECTVERQLLFSIYYETMEELQSGKA